MLAKVRDASYGRFFRWASHGGGACHALQTVVSVSIRDVLSSGRRLAGSVYDGVATAQCEVLTRGGSQVASVVRVRLAGEEV